MALIAVGIQHEEWYPVPTLHPTGRNLVAVESDVVERYNVAHTAFKAVLAEIREAEEAQERLVYGGLTWREHERIMWARASAEQAEAQRRDRQQRQWG